MATDPPTAPPAAPPPAETPAAAATGPGATAGVAATPAAAPPAAASPPAPVEPACDCRVWILAGPAAAPTPEVLLEKAVAAARRIAPGWAPAADCAGVRPAVVHQVQTIDVRIPCAARGGAEALETELAAALAGARDHAGLAVFAGSPAPLPPDGRPCVEAGRQRLTDLGRGATTTQRWHLDGPDPGTQAETLRRLHRVAVAEFLLVRHHAEARTYADEIGKELSFIDRSINKVLRFKIEGQDRPGLIGQLEQNVKELSTNYAKLNRNAGIFRDIVVEEERLVRLLRAAVTELAPAAVAGSTEAVFAPRLDRADEELDACRRRERELQDCLHSAQTAITTQGMNIELLRSGELIELQKHTGELLKKGVSLQAAAVLIEFIVLFAYSLHAWEMLLGEGSFHSVPGWIRFFAPLLFSGGMVLSAHSFADYIKEGHFPRWAWWAASGTVLAFAAMASAPALFPAHEAQLRVRFGGHEYEVRSGAAGEGVETIEVETHPGAEKHDEKHEEKPPQK